MHEVRIHAMGEGGGERRPFQKTHLKTFSITPLFFENCSVNNSLEKNIYLLKKSFAAN